MLEAKDGFLKCASHKATKKNKKNSQGWRKEMFLQTTKMRFLHLFWLTVKKQMLSIILVTDFLVF